MPLYDLECEAGHRFERMIPLAEFEAPQFCICNAPAHRRISAPMFSVESVGYHCPITDKWIGSKREHIANLDRHGCRVQETGEKEAYLSRRAAEEAAFDRKIEATVERELDSWSSAKKEQLSNELINGGLTAEVQRN